ncbi:MAG: prepilin-type N-terminal cleavage/methylation domain-containing protein [Pseudomonadota bacterium]
MPRRRRAGERGFSMVEAIVALTIAAMTLALLSGAAFSLRMIAARSAAPEEAVELLSTRRVLRRWASATVLRGAGSTASFAGSATEIRLLFGPDLWTDAPAQLAMLRIERVGEEYRLAAYRRSGAASVWQDVEAAPREASELLRSAVPLRFSYEVANPEGPGTVWITAREAGPPPRAFALDIAGGRRVVAPIAQEMDPGCLAAFGVGEFQRDRCSVQ